MEAAIAPFELGLQTVLDGIEQRFLDAGARSAVHAMGRGVLGPPYVRPRNRKTKVPRRRRNAPGAGTEDAPPEGTWHRGV